MKSWFILLFAMQIASELNHAKTVFVPILALILLFKYLTSNIIKFKYCGLNFLELQFSFRVKVSIKV